MSPAWAAGLLSFRPPSLGPAGAVEFSACLWALQTPPPADCPDFPAPGGPCASWDRRPDQPSHWKCPRALEGVCGAGAGAAAPGLRRDAGTPQRMAQLHYFLTLHLARESEGFSAASGTLPGTPLQRQPRGPESLGGSRSVFSGWLISSRTLRCPREKHQDPQPQQTLEYPPCHFPCLSPDAATKREEWGLKVLMD